MKKRAKKVERKNLGPLVKDLLNKNLLTQAEVADAIGMSRSQICNFLKGQTDVHASTFADILDAVGINLRELLLQEHHSTPENQIPYQLKLISGLERDTVVQFLKVYQKRAAKEERIA